jgi:hypothetical protein
MKKTQHTRLLWVLLTLVAMSGLWYLFRPERLVLDETVDEPLPGLVMPRPLPLPGPDG